MKRLISLFLLCVMLVSCGREIVYKQFQSLPLEGWHCDSALEYTFAIADSVASYEVQLIVRHSTQYPYQNLWFFTEEWYGNMLLHSDTIECFLADEYGRWQGAGISTYTMPLLYYPSHTFPCTGEYKLVIKQGMRSEWLQGIEDVGVEVVR